MTNEERLSVLEADNFALTGLIIALVRSHPNPAALEQLVMHMTEHMEARSGLSTEQADRARRLIETVARATRPSQGDQV